MKRARVLSLSVLLHLCGDGSSFCFLARSCRRMPRGEIVLDDYGPRPTRARIKLPARKKRNGGHHRPRHHPKSDRQIETKVKMKEAQLVEKLLNDAVSKMDRMNIEQGHGESMVSKLFPSGRYQGRRAVLFLLIWRSDSKRHDFTYQVRECNAALATFGDSGDFRRAIGLFMQMKKSARSGRPHKPVASQQSLMSAYMDLKHTSATLLSLDMVLEPPKPSLVTYSTLISRAISLGKPRVALRLWNLMRNQPEFYLNVLSRKRIDGRLAEELKAVSEEQLRSLEEEGAIVPDVIFCNTLMNAYAKLGDHVSARSILNAMLGTSTSQVHEGIPQIEPTVITYNTLADACKKGGELGHALEVLDLMKNRAAQTGDKSLLPDELTYTILISTVARKSKSMQTRDVRSGGEKDPDMAFELLERMISEGITPNGVTYCALIDVCSRCQRVDMALNGLRLMRKQKTKSSSVGKRGRSTKKNAAPTLFNEVGAWTSAINACGKYERIDTAIRLFRTMIQQGVKPNVYTVACLCDCLLKTSPMRMSETLEVLQYMKQEGIVPSEVMYTSLMSVALKLAEEENKSVVLQNGLQVSVVDTLEEKESPRTARSSSTPEAIVLYTELLQCLIPQEEDDNILLRRVFLVFNEMRSAGATPDHACYNSLLRACALSGDATKAMDVLERMSDDGLAPNRRSWREALRSTQKAKLSGMAESIWEMAVNYETKGDYVPFVPNISDVELLLSVYVAELTTTNSHIERNALHRRVIALYEDLIECNQDRGFRYDSIRIDELERNQYFMLAVLRACVSLEYHGESEDEREHSKAIACDIAGLPIFRARLDNIDRASKKAITLAQNWMFSL